MNRNTLINLAFGLSIGLSCGLLLNKPCCLNNEQQSFVSENNNYIVDTIEVIEEDSIRWYTLDTTWYTVDTVKYESIDTTVIYWPWGREEFYYFKYKEN